MDLLDALLNLVDAVSTAAGFVALWYAWVVPSRRKGLPPPQSPSPPDELEAFLHTATLNRTSGDTPA